MNTIWYILFFLAFFMIILSLIISTSLQKKIRRVIEKYANFITQCQITVFDFATILVARAGLDINIEIVNSKTSNNYSSKYKVLKLTTEYSKSQSMIALAKCAQEIGYAILDQKQNSKLYKLRVNLFDTIKILIGAFTPLLLIGLLCHYTFGLSILGLCFAILAVIFLIFALIFFILTRGTEKKATEQIFELLINCEFIVDEEVYCIKEILHINSTIYLYNLVSSILFFLNFITMPNI